MNNWRRSASDVSHGRDDFVSEGGDLFGFEWPKRYENLMLALAHGAADLALAGHLSAKGKGAAEPESLLDDLIRLLRTSAR